MLTLKFYKESDNRWYVDLPDYPGTKPDLEMVAGADIILDYIANGDNHTTLLLSEEYFENSNKLQFISLASEFNNGAFYFLKSYDDVTLNQEIWLCDVMKFVFGKFPEQLFIATKTIGKSGDFNTDEIQ